MTRIKICGITNKEDSLQAVELGADAIGFIFAESSRRIDPEKARAISFTLPPFINKVGVFTDSMHNEIERIINYCRLDTVQLHNTEAIDNGFSVPTIRVFQIGDNEVIETIRELKINCFLLDTYDKKLSGGTGRSFDWEIARKATRFGKVILAGGLNHLNIRQALDAVHPYAVDVSSGIEERPGKKDHQKMRLFINEVRNWDSQTS